MNVAAMFRCLLALFAAGAIVHAADGVRIVPTVHDNTVLISVTLPDAYTPDVRDAISSGLRTTFTYEIALRMDVPVWVDRTIATAIVTTSDQYDNLTRRHHLSRVVEGRIDGEMVTEDEAQVRRWLTTLSRVPLCGTSRLDPNRDYYIRLAARLRPDRDSLLGWASTITGSARFTFIP